MTDFLQTEPRQPWYYEDVQRMEHSLDALDNPLLAEAFRSSNTLMLKILEHQINVAEGHTQGYRELMLEAIRERNERAAALAAALAGLEEAVTVINNTNTAIGLMAQRITAVEQRQDQADAVRADLVTANDLRLHNIEQGQYAMRITQWTTLALVLAIGLRSVYVIVDGSLGSVAAIVVVVGLLVLAGLATTVLYVRTARTPEGGAL